MEYKPLPQDKEVETQILGAMLQAPACIEEVKQLVIAADFYGDAHKKIFKCLLEMEREGKEIDLVSATSELRGQGLKLAGELSRIVNQTPTTANWQGHCVLLKKLAILRKYITGTQTLIDQAYECRDVEGIIAGAQRLAGSLDLNKGDDLTASAVGDFLPDVLNELEKEVETRKKTGLQALDAMTGGLFDGEVTVLAGATSQGKTSLALTIALNLLLAGEAVYFQSCEMPKEQLTYKLLSMMSGVPLRAFREHALNSADWHKVNEILSALNSFKLFLNDTSVTTVSALRSHILKINAKTKLSCIVVDYLQLLEAEERGLSQEQRICDNSRKLKLLAMEFNLPVIVLSQLSRQTEKMPKNSDLRGSGSIEQDADTIIFIQTDRSNCKSRLFITKQRMGACGDFTVNFDLETTLLSDDTYLGER